MATIIDQLFEPGCRYKRLFICGKITGDPDYQLKFNKAAQALSEAGFAVMNPAVLPSEGFSHNQYMKISLAMLSVCDAVMFLNDWMHSPGAIEELEEATRSGRPGFSYEMWRAEYLRRNGS